LVGAGGAVESVGAGVRDGSAVLVGRAVALGESVSVGPGVAVGICVRVGTGVQVRDGTTELVSVGMRVQVRDGVTERVRVEVGVEVGTGLFPDGGGGVWVAMRAAGVRPVPDGDGVTPDDPRVILGEGDNVFPAVIGKMAFVALAEPVEFTRSVTVGRIWTSSPEEVGEGTASPPIAAQAS
jgi:hypothetical protein